MQIASKKLNEEFGKNSASRPVVLVVAGSDSAGMAGMQMDIRTHDAFGVHCATAVTAVTAQNSGGMLALNPVTDAQLRQQLDAIGSLQPVVVKAGLLASSGQVRVLCDFLDRSGLPLVYDPVLRSSSGASFCADVHSDEDLRAAIVHELLPRCHLLTPNLDEAQSLSGHRGTGRRDAEAMAARLAAQMAASGAKAVLVKGGHREGSAWAQDYFYSAEQSFWLSSPRRDTANSRGTGCALASSASAALALGFALPDAVVIAKMAINQGLRQAYACAGQSGPVHITGFPDQAEDLPCLHREEAAHLEQLAFPDCGDTALGLYPVVDRAAWLERLLPLGIKTVQLRIKDLQGQALAQEIATAVAISKRFDCHLFINDYWQLAIQEGAYGVHLGQEDIAGADLDLIRTAGLRLGLSTHCHYEVARSHTLKPSYLACGPVYHTNTKQMPWTPHGIDGLAYWRKVLATYPLVAIGGIDLQRMKDVLQTGVDGIALITAITHAPNPEFSARQLLEQVSAGTRRNAVKNSMA